MHLGYGNLFAFYYAINLARQLSQYLYSLQNWDAPGALADYNEAVRISPNFALAYRNRGNVIRELGDNKGAVADYNEALRINPNYALAYDNRGDARRALGDRQGAIADFQKAANLFQQQGNKNDYQNTLNKIANLKPQI